jgi:hypothetical protein
MLAVMSGKILEWYIFNDFPSLCAYHTLHGKNVKVWAEYSVGFKQPFGLVKTSVLGCHLLWCLLRYGTH